MLHERWSMAAELLPTDRQLAALLRKITLAGQQTGVQFLMFKPSAPKTEQYYVELPVEIAIYGGYHQVGSFLAELSNMQRIVTVSSIKLLTNTKGDALATTSASLTASAYSLSSTPTPAPAVKPAAATPATQKGEPSAHKQS
jgi:type IV pilus assembly protein PilO